MTQTCYIEGYLYTSISEMSSSNKSFTVQGLKKQMVIRF